MNKLGTLSVLVVVCSVTSVYASLNKNDLEKAIRSLDVATVRQIVATETLTLKESDRYLDLANQMINDRKFSVKGSFLNRDVVTSCDKTTEDKATLEKRIGVGLAFAGGSNLLLAPVLALENDHRNFSASLSWGSVLTLAGIALIVKSYYTLNDYINTELRPKRDDAITIKQLLYTAHVEGV